MNSDFEIHPSIEMGYRPQPLPEITEQDKERFFKSIISDRPYEEELSVFDGQLKIKFRVMTVQENADVVKQIMEDKENGEAGDNDAYLVRISAYRLGLSLLEIDGKPYSSVTRDNYEEGDDTDSSYILSRVKPILSWSTPKLSAYLDAFQQFERKLVKLTSEVQTVNFWKASV